jgi:hypothetical protein
MRGQSVPWRTERAALREWLDEALDAYSRA